MTIYHEILHASDGTVNSGMFKDKYTISKSITTRKKFTTEVKNSIRLGFDMIGVGLSTGFISESETEAQITEERSVDYEVPNN